MNVKKCDARCKKNLLYICICISQAANTLKLSRLLDYRFSDVPTVPSF